MTINIEKEEQMEKVIQNKENSSQLNQKQTWLELKHLSHFNQNKYYHSSGVSLTSSKNEDDNIKSIINEDSSEEDVQDN